MSDVPTAGQAPDAAARVAFLDASVLYPATLRNLLMHFAVAGVFQARWTDKVQDEWTAALLRDRVRVPLKRTPVERIPHL